MKALRTFSLGIALAAGLTGGLLFAQQKTPPPGGSGTGDLRDLSSDDATTFGIQPVPAIPAVPTYDPFRTQSQAAQLAQSYVKTQKEEDKTKIRKKLTDVLGEQFDQHSKRQEKELEDIEKQIASLKTVLKKRLDAKSTIVERRVDQLIHDADGMGWAPNSLNWDSTPFSHGIGIGHGMGGATQPAAPANQATQKKE
jgi:hypothetical protein